MGRRVTLLRSLIAFCMLNLHMNLNVMNLNYTYPWAGHRHTPRKTIRLGIPWNARMMDMNGTLLAAILLLLGLQTFGTLHADDWNSIRGNDGLGKWNGSTRLSNAKKIGLKIRWKKKLGSGYSSVVVNGGKAVTLFTDGKQDQVACLDAKTGDTIWTFAMEPVFVGSNGSFDGPLATPVIHKGIVFCLSARGKLFALNLKTGEQKWVRDFVKEEEATQPMYGFSTTPLVSGDTLIVLAGAKKGALVGLDVLTGTTKWHAGTGPISSQIPVAVNLSGNETIVTGAGRNVMGVDPRTGKVLFNFPHNGANGSAMMPVPFDNDKLLFTNDDSFSRAFQIKPGEDGLVHSEVWSDRSIKNTYNVPVAMGSELYAYSTRILTCVDQKTGKPKWKSRKPGDGFLIGVDNHLVIITKKGSVHIAKNSTRKYDEVASLKVFDNLVWAIPAYSENAVFVRSFKEIACVEFVGDRDSRLVGTKATQQLGTGFKTFLGKVELAESVAAKSDQVTQFLKKQTRFPVVEDGIAHFLYRGDAKDVALACDVFGARQEEKMTKVEGTDLFYYSLKLPADQRVSYVYLVDYKPIKDPLNKRTMTSSMYAGEMEFAIRLQNEKPLEMSWFGMQDWKQPSWTFLHRRRRLVGKMVPEKIEWKDGKSFDVDVYLPPTYEKQTDKKYPTIYVHDGVVAQKLGELEEMADMYFQTREDREAIVVFLKTSPTRSVVPFLNDIATQVVPFVDKKYRTLADRKHRASVGAGFGGSAALGLTAMHSDVFGACSVQSPLVFDQARTMAIGGFQKIDQPTRLYVEWGRFDMHNPVENWDIREMANTMKTEIAKNSQVRVLGGRVNDSTDWGSWKYRFDKVVEALFEHKK